MIRKFLCITSLLGLLSACSSLQETVPVTEPAPAPAPLPETAPTLEVTKITPNNVENEQLIADILAGTINLDDLEPTAAGSPATHIAAREFLYQDQDSIDRYGAYGYALLTKRPQAKTAVRYEKFARAYLGNLEETSSFQHTPSEFIAPTFWLLNTKPNELIHAQLSDPNTLVTHYDYARAKSLLQASNKQGAEGPILVAWQKAFTQGGTTEELLVFDLSRFSDEDMERAMSIWISQISKDPTLWQKGFNVVTFREEVRNFIQRYGEQILAVVQPSS